MKEKISRNKISSHYKSFFELENMALAENDRLMIDWGEYLINELVNQEVERRIKERMPSEEEQDKWADYCAGNTTSDHNKAVLYKAALSLGATWLRSRLVSQKTEGGGE